ncbi:hypothetical protein CDL15_Pgr007125 [Punica granatum]|nr:hypothetical protein CDL15_Pgr007125 [Punica granatum]PKI65563.1 hypothetical protein CRG98_014063 [Punica granatum]
MAQWGSLIDPFRGFSLEEDSSEARMDWRETPDAHVFDVDLPGLSKEEVKLQLVPEGRVLQITAERKEEEEEGKGDRWHCRERTERGGYFRQFRLPDDAKVHEIKASMQDGVLTVVVPKDKEAQRGKKSDKGHKKAIEISGDDGGHAKDHKRLIGRFVCCKA